MVEQEERLYKNQEDVEPRPLRRMMVETEPQMRDKEHADRGHRTDEKAEKERNGERKLGEKDDRVDHRQQRHKNVLGDPLVELKGGIVAEGLRPSAKAAGQRQR